MKRPSKANGQRYVARAPGVNRAQLNELRAGKLHVEETLDLHGDTIARGLERLREFLRASADERRASSSSTARYALRGRAPLREAVLSELLVPAPVTCTRSRTAAPVHGGEGAPTSCCEPPMKLLASAVVLVALVLPASAKPGPRAKRAAQATKRTPVNPLKIGAHARVTYQRAGDMRPAREDTLAKPRRPEPLTVEEETAESIQKLLRGPVLRRGVTGLFVADAKTGEPLFAVNASDPMNPASNVKLISTATALELLGPEFRYPTRVLGPAPTGAIVKGDVYLLGSYDPTLSSTDLHEIAASMARTDHRDRRQHRGRPTRRATALRAIIPTRDRGRQRVSRRPRPLVDFSS